MTVHRHLLLRSTVLFLCVLLIAGCGPKKDPSTAAKRQSSNEGLAENARQIDSLAQARRQFQIGDFESAAESAYKALLQNPDSADAKLVASEIEAARGNHQASVDLASSIDMRSRLGPRAVEIHFQQLLEMKRPSEAADVILKVLEVDLSTDQRRYWRDRAATVLVQAGRWQDAIHQFEGLVAENPDADASRHRLADLLNQRGFRFDANEHVRELCRRSGATLAQLRGLMVPSRSHTGFSEKPNIKRSEQVEAQGEMNVARALLSSGDARDAAVVMGRSQLVQDNHPAAVAFYGQVLLESQLFDEFEDWLANVDPDCKRYPSFWMAMGGWAMRQRQYESAVRMFAEAILREPGDLAANDRMTQALAAAGQHEASQRFRRRGVAIDGLIARTRVIFASPTVDLASINALSQSLDDIGRPLESVAWSRIALDAIGSPVQAMRQLDKAIAHLGQTDSQASVRETQLCGLDLHQFPLDLSSLTIDGSRREQNRAGGTPMESKQDPAPSREPAFVDIAREVGLDFRYRNAIVPVEREFRIFQQLGAGVACFDYDMDGNVDLYLGQASADPPQSRGTEPNLLARNVGDRFQNVTAPAACDDRGYTAGVTSGDWNQDGFPDLVVGNMLANTLFLNQGDGTFVIHRGDSAWGDPKYTASLAMGDVNGDHLPDIVEVNYLDDPHIYDPIQYKPDGTPVSLPGPLNFQAADDRVFLSRGDGSMTVQVLNDSTRTDPASGLGVVVTDIDVQGGNEIFVANDHLANHFWTCVLEPEGECRWKNTAAASGLAYGSDGTPLGCMGIAVADFDENGLLDLHVTNFENQWSNHYMQSAPGFFEDLVVAYRLERLTYKMLGFGTQALDYDNNSVTDLVVGNGHVDDYTEQGRAFEMPTQILSLQQSRYVARQVSGDPGYWESGHLSRGLATCDWNSDGRLDFVVTDLKQSVSLLENRTDTPYHWLQLKLVGTNAERDAIGTVVKASFGPRTITQVVQSGDGYMCKNQFLLSFGLGGTNSIDRLEIRWPDGTVQTLNNVAADQRYLIVQGEQEPFRLPVP